jgi:hypothetical protein
MWREGLRAWPTRPARNSPFIVIVIGILSATRYAIRGRSVERLAHELHGKDGSSFKPLQRFTERRKDSTGHIDVARDTFKMS